MKARIRDFFENKDGWIFAVADYIHPRGIRSLLRYVPDKTGERVTNGIRYRKVDFDQAFEFLRKVRPVYIRDVHEVPVADISKIYLPSVGLRRVVERDSRVKIIVKTLNKDGIPCDEMGITGSMLVGLQGTTSDIDFVVYGPMWWKARGILDRAKENGTIQEIDDITWQKIYSKRKPEIGFDEFVLHEKRKGNRGMVEGTYFDLLFTRSWGQIQILEPGKTIKKIKIEAKVIDTEFAFDSPAIFKLDHEYVKEILCYSHTYAGQALQGETVEAQGVLEETISGQRLVVGTTREAKGEWIRSLTLLEGGN